ncbi:5337_t:CDS:1, partial [Scutellospora calospora]
IESSISATSIESSTLTNATRYQYKVLLQNNSPSSHRQCSCLPLSHQQHLPLIHQQQCLPSFYQQQHLSSIYQQQRSSLIYQQQRSFSIYQ